jgi:hypothetical protein
MFCHTGASRDAGIKPAMGGTGDCEGMASNDNRSGSDVWNAAIVFGVSNLLMSSTKEIAP